jgi:hypothetical protein
VVPRWPIRTSDASAPSYGMVDDQHDNRANHGNKHAVEVEAGDPSGAELREQKAADNGADDAKDDVEDQALAGLIPTRVDPDSRVEFPIVEKSDSMP